MNKHRFTLFRIVAIILLCSIALSGCLDTGNSALTSPDEENEYSTSDTPQSVLSENQEIETTTAHEHIFDNASCTFPQTCSVCGDTQGDPLGHLWSEATCTLPATCSICGAVDGEANGHDWKSATCTAPVTCNACGETDGEPVDHSWQSATCTTAKTCKVCDKTTGSPSAHKYSKGKCSTCGTKDPSYNGSTSSMVWIPTNGGKKYHCRSSCSNMKNPEKVTLSRAKQLGFTACKKCYG